MYLDVMDITEFKQLYDEHGPVIAKLRASEVCCHLSDVMAIFPEAYRLLPNNWTELERQLAIVLNPEHMDLLNNGCINNDVWVLVMTQHKKYIHEFTNWHELNTRNWCDLIVANPELVDIHNVNMLQFDMLDTFTILVNQPHLKDKLNIEIISDDIWALHACQGSVDILQHHPNIQRLTEHSLWATIIENHPHILN
jgi:hypothetical protein